MPPIAIIVKAIEKNSKEKIEDRAVIVADKIIENLLINGSTKFPEIYNDPTAHYLMTKRWPYKKWASEIIKSEIKWWKKEFCESYRANVRKDSKNLLEYDNGVLQIATNSTKKLIEMMSLKDIMERGSHESKRMVSKETQGV